MCRCGDEAYVALRVAAVDVVVADDRQTAVLACRTRVGLQRDTCESGDDGQHILHLLDHLQRALGLVSGCEGVHTCKAAPAQRQHLGGSVELHSAAAQRNHSAVQAQVLNLEFLHIAHHLGLAVVAVEYAVGQIFAGAEQVFGDIVEAGAATLAVALQQLRLLAGSLGQDGDDGVDIVLRGSLVEADADALLADVAEVDLVLLGHLADSCRRHGALQCQCVEEHAVVLLVAVFLKLFGQDAGHSVDVCGNVADAFRTVPSSVEAAHNSLQSRSGADVRGGLLALDVLLAHTQSHTQCGVALHVDTPADDAAGEAALESLGDGEETCVRTAEAHRQTEALVAAKGAVGTHLAGSLEQGQGHQVGGHTHEDAQLVSLGDELGVVRHLAKLVGILDHGAEEGVVELYLGGLADNNLYAARSGVGAHHVEGLREDAVVDENLADVILLLLAAAAVVEHNHTFAAGGSLVEQRCVGQRHSGHIAHHRLVGHQSLEAALADLGLIRSISCVPAGVLKHVALDDGRRDGAVVAHTDVRFEHLVLLGQSAAAVQELKFVDAVGNGHRLVEAYGLGHSLVDKFLHRGDADGFKHFFFVSGLRNAVVTSGEIVGNHRIISIILYINPIDLKIQKY